MDWNGEEIDGTIPRRSFMVRGKRLLVAANERLTRPVMRQLLDYVGERSGIEGADCILVLPLVGPGGSYILVNLLAYPPGSRKALVKKQSLEMTGGRLELVVESSLTGDEWQVSRLAGMAVRR